MRRRIAASGSDLDVALEETLLVAPPDSLPDRLLLAHEWRQRRRKKRILAATAAAALAAISAMPIYTPPPVPRSAHERELVPR